MISKDKYLISHDDLSHNEKLREINKGVYIVDLKKNSIHDHIQ